MSGNTTFNSDPVIRAQVYSEFLLETINDQFLPEGLHRDVTDFGDGDVLNIPTIGEMPIYDIEEDKETPLAALDTGNVTLTITEHVGVGGYTTDKLKEDAYKAMAVESQIPTSSLRGIRERYETDMLATANDAHTSGDANTFNDVDHRWVAGGASGTDGIISFEDLAYLKWAFDEANMPDEGRILLVAPSVEATFNTTSNIVQVQNNPMFEGLITEGFSRGRKFLTNIFGFDIWTSSRLPRIASETITGGPDGGEHSVASDGVANIAMCIADDQTKPVMGAWRRQPAIEGHRNTPKRRDEFYVTARWGFGSQRLESQAVIVTSRTAYK